ncbi:TlpA disulfide reductase family protein [Flammeovirga pacifica]|uniref:Thioredoxin domain-containing protein n=1 Tax=Flammeovirga pacifica TaxID=915059 RepID=A0A1S1YZZ8_FLAPC|nr:TlpA disulfide reductase family protein [Flammeovirga pacifica]OHX66581.1 hypothetical protein NH26_09530 [Flammeovirga pacifica]
MISCEKSNTNTQASHYPADITISGKIDNVNEGAQVTLFEIQKAGKKDVQTTKTKADGSFSMKYKVDKIGLYTINVGNVTEDVLVLEDKDLTVTNSKFGLDVHGSNENELLHNLKVQYDGFSEKESALNQEYVNAEDKEAVVKKIKELGDERSKTMLQSLKDLDGAYITLFVLNFINDRDQYLKEITAAVNRMAERFPEDENVKEVHAAYMKLNNTSVGNVAQDIVLNDVNGKEIALSSLKGKYVMIDFWASWCTPCRMENPNVLKAYNKYKSKGFEVYGISLDQKVENWKKAIKKDGITWLQVHDAQNTAADAYGVQSIPFTLLLDKEGKIIAKNLRGNALEMKLAELLD